MAATLSVERAIADGCLELYRQPIVALRGNAGPRSELLLRIVGVDGPPRSGSAFVREAELTGEIVELDRWVVLQALAIRAAEQRTVDPACIHVNLSGLSLIDSGVLESIKEALDSSAADPAGIVFEITETAAVDNFDRACDFADQLAEFGCSIAIDDYGAGLMPEEFLRTLPFDLLKIDASLTRRLAELPAPVAAVVETAAEIGVRTIAEGVEEARILELLRSLGVDMAQGFMLGRPEPLERVG